MEDKELESKYQGRVILGNEQFAINYHIELFKSFMGREPNEEERQKIISGIKEEANKVK